MEMGSGGGSTSGLRKRGAAASQPLSPKLPTALKSFDLYSKVHDDYNVRTKSGGTLSLLVYTCMAVLILGEIHSWGSAVYQDHIVVDVTLDQKLPIGINITFPNLRCDEVGLIRVLLEFTEMSN